ncbi:MAG TPA: CaiB/BaiF CoA-transferase family protein [Ideonella sp.]|uniref:CaiB/BaiF CoA transferase family protein n=1 Tax=Ideonella sp. TaxID=1929293 RepID=UPI002E3333EB|nr:CaiB/BaiF CoA-transferase family protein [Ideonella sp.]HEX5683489.1 CaiB/BaiF CoA-transferase family protein [Ideonella sp.]
MGPLHGLRVIELASIGPGPMCAMLLADLGAEVVRIDRIEPSGLGVPVQTRFDVPGRSRRSIALDLKSDAGREAARRLIGSADVLIEGWRPGVAERLGLGPEDCHARHPGLVYGRMTGYGQTGPLAQTAGHDINYIALTGALHAIGGHDGQAGAPVPPLNLVGDYGGGALYLAFGVLAALYERQRSGRGQVVDAAMVDGVGSLLALFHGLAAGGQWDVSRRAANLLDGGAPFYATYETADGGWLAVGALEPKFFAELAQLVGLGARFVQRQYDRRLWPEMREALAAILRSRPRDEWAALFEGSDACVTPVLSMTEATQHPQAQQRQSFVDVDGVTQPAPTPRFGRSRPGTPRPAPLIGQHTRELLAEAGYSETEIATLLAGGSARQTMPA